MSIWTIVELLLALFCCWFGVAYLVAAVRFTYWPLLFPGVGGLLMCVPLVYHVVTHTWSNVAWLFWIGVLLINGFWFLRGQRYQELLQKRGVTAYKLLFFKKSRVR